ncbi:MAG: alpha/beta fold hydrolase [Caldisericia bacterium]
MKKFFKYFLIFLFLILIIYYLYSIVSIRLSYKEVESLKDSDSKFIEIDNFNLHYKEYGEKDKVILLIHGFAANSFSFKNLFEPLSKYGRVIAIDLPGFGLTERVDKNKVKFNPYSIDGQVETIKIFLDKKHIDKVIILGHSMGGGIATYFSIKYPEYVEKLIIEDGAIFEGKGPPNLIVSFLRTPIGKFLWPALVKPLVNQISKLLDIAYYNKSIINDEFIQGYKRILNVKNWDKGLYEVTIANNNINLIDKLSNIETKTLIIWGEFDKVIPVESGIKLNKEIKNSELVILKECGHVPHEEKEVEFLEKIILFIEK